MKDIVQLSRWNFQHIGSDPLCCIVARKAPKWGESYDALMFIQISAGAAKIEPFLSLKRLTFKDFAEVGFYLSVHHQCTLAQYSRWIDGVEHKKTIQIKKSNK